MFPYKRLEAWKVCHELTLAVYGATREFPPEELYGLTSQARRAAVSAAANIAEGSAKRGPREFRRFLDISLGSLAELSYILQLARELSMLPQNEWSDLERIRGRAGYLTWQLYKSIAGTTSDN